MNKNYAAFLLFPSFLFSGVEAFSQNISVNTTGAANSTSSMFEVLQPSTASGASGIFSRRSGSLAAGGSTAYAFWSEVICTGATSTNIAGYFSASGATNNYAIIVPSGGGRVGIGTIAPGYPFTIGVTGDVFGVENTANFVAKNSGGTYETYFWPRWSDNIMYMNYGSAGFNIRNNSSTTTMFMDNNGQVGIGTGATIGARLHIAEDDSRAELKIGEDFWTDGGDNHNRIMIGNSNARVHVRFGQGANDYGYTGWIYDAVAANAYMINQTWSTASGPNYGGILALQPYGGRVGVGTGAPGSLLHVQSPNALDVPTGDVVFSRYWASGTDTRASSIFHYYNSATSNDNLAFGVAGGGGTLGQPNALAQIKMIIQGSGNVGIGTTAPQQKLDVRGVAAVNGGTLYGSGNNMLTTGALNIGDYGRNYGGGSGWGANTAGLLLECLDNSEIAVHDFATRVASMMYFEGAGTNRLTIGRDMGWGAITSIALSGNTGIKASAITYPLTIGVTGDVFGIENTANFVAKNSGGTYETYLWPRWSDNIMYMNYGSAGFQIRTNSSFNVMFMDNSAQVGVGRTTPDAQLHVNATFKVGDLGVGSRQVLEVVAGSGDVTIGSQTQDADVLIRNQAGTNIIHFGANSSSWFNGSSLGIGCTNPQYPLHVVGNMGVVGTIFATAASVSSGVSACSDARYKKKISILENSLDKILALQGVNYFWKTNEFPDKNFSNDIQIGFIAQELEKIYPELVVTDKDGYKSVDYSRLTPALVEAIKEQQELIKKLQFDVSSLKAENQTIKLDFEERLRKIEEQIGAKAEN